MNGNYKVKIKDIQSKYTFKIFCAGADTSGIEQEIGDLSSLTTTTKTDLVSAINEVDGNTTTNATAITNLQNNKEDKSNKTTTLSSSSTDTQYPSAKCVYDSQVSQDTAISTLETNLEETKEELDYYKTIYNVLPKVTGEGESITLSNTGESILKLDLKGQCKQDSTTGKQLFNKELTPTSTSNATISQLDTGIKLTLSSTSGNAKIKLGGNEILGKTITIKTTMSASSSNTTTMYLAYVNDSGTNILSVGASRLDATGIITYTIRNEMPENATQLDVVFMSEGASSNYVNFTDFMIVEGTYTSETFPNYEPYTNGASPNPSYPQQIHEVSGDNEVRVEGTNLFSLKDWLDTLGATYTENSDGSITFTTQTSLYNTTYPIKETDRVVFSYKITNGTGTNFRFRFMYDDGTETSTSGSSTGTSEVSVSTTSTMDKKVIGIRGNWSSTGTFTIREAMVEEYVYGVSPRPYEPYNRDTYELSLGDIKMRGIGTYEDYFVRNSGKNLVNVDDYTTDAQGGTFHIIDTPLIETGKTYIISAITEDGITLTNQNASLNGRDSNNNIIVSYAFNRSFTLEDISNVTNWGILTTNALTSKKIKRVMLNEGSTALPYEPYGTGQWCKYNAIGKVVLDGVDEDIRLDGTLTNVCRFRIVNMVSALNRNALCNSNINDNAYSGDYEHFSIGSDLTNIYYFISTQLSSDVSSFKTWLSTHNIEVDYVLATPYLSLIEDTTLISQLDKAEKVLAKQGQTNILQVNNDAPFKIYASALREIE